MEPHKAMLILAWFTLSTSVRAQDDRPSPAAPMARADSAYDSGDRDQARLLYREVLARDNTASRAIFRLAQLEESDTRALTLYRRYIALEPDDAWGHMAEGDVLGRMGRVNEAFVAYERARNLAPAERDVALGRARLLERAGRPQQAVEELADWVSLHPDDGEGWDLLGRARMRLGRPRSAADAFDRASQSGVSGAGARLHAAQAAASPIVVPEAASLGDSDGIRTTRFGGSVDVMVADGVRLGARVQRHDIADDVDDVQGTEVSARFAAVASPAMRISLDAGAMRYVTSAVPGTPPGMPPGMAPARQTTWTALQAAARFRARAPGSGASIDFRAERAPLGYSPTLIANRVQRSEARATVELPVLGARARGTGRLASIEARGEPPNLRGTLEGGLVLPLGGVQPSLQYRVTGFGRASAAGYFAPRRAETIEGGLYLEAGEDGPVSIAVDAGGGVQRVTGHDDAAGAWTNAWRAWALASLSLGHSRAWFVELEAYDAPFALDGTGAGGSWRSLALSSGVRWAIR